MQTKIYIYIIYWIIYRFKNNEYCFWILKCRVLNTYMFFIFLLPSFNFWIFWFFYFSISLFFDFTISIFLYFENFRFLYFSIFVLIFFCPFWVPFSEGGGREKGSEYSSSRPKTVFIKYASSWLSTTVSLPFPLPKSTKY